MLLSQLQPLSRSASSSHTLFVPLVLRDGTSGLTSTGTVTVSVCPCLRGGARAGEKEKDKETEGEWDWEREAVCLPQQSTLPSPGLSTAALLAILACVATLLGKHQHKPVVLTITPVWLHSECNNNRYNADITHVKVLNYTCAPGLFTRRHVSLPVKEVNDNLQIEKVDE